MPPRPLHGPPGSFLSARLGRYARDRAARWADETGKWLLAPLPVAPSSRLSDVSLGNEVRGGDPSPGRVARDPLVPPAKPQLPQ